MQTVPQDSGLQGYAVGVMVMHAYGLHMWQQDSGLQGRNAIWVRVSVEEPGLELGLGLGLGRG